MADKYVVTGYVKRIGKLMSIEIVTDERYDNVEIGDIGDNGYFRIKQKPDCLMLHKDDLTGFIAALTRLGQKEKA